MIEQQPVFRKKGEDSVLYLESFTQFVERVTNTANSSINDVLQICYLSEETAVIVFNVVSLC